MKHDKGRRLGFAEDSRGNSRGKRAHETHRVQDFNTLDDLIAHARDELGATHVLFVDEEVHLYFPRQEGTYEKAEIWQKDGYWHTQGPGARTIVQKPPSNAQPIGGGRAKPMPKHDPKGSLPIIENGLRKLSGHPIDVRMGAAEARRSFKTPKEHVVEQVQNGHWTQVGHFHTKDAALRFAATVPGKKRVIYTWPSAYDYPIEGGRHGTHKPRENRNPRRSAHHKP